MLMLDVFGDWCVFLPRIDGDQDNGLEYIQHFPWFYYQNQAGIARPGEPDHPHLYGGATQLVVVIRERWHLSLSVLRPRFLWHHLAISGSTVDLDPA